MISPSSHLGDPDSENGLSRLWPPDIPALIKPIHGDEGYHGGIGAAALKADLLAIVEPWLEIGLGDKCLFFWDDDVSPIETQIIDTPEKLNEKLYFNIPVKQIQDGSAFPVFFRVIRSSGNRSDSDKLNVLVKQTLPGGVLDKPEPLGHPGLRYTLIPDIKGGVDKEMARNGIAMRIHPYQNITVFDRIVARWGNEEQVIHYPVTRDQIEDPTNHPIIITFDEALIKRAGNGTHEVTYQVIDRCNNRPHEHAPWAPVTKVAVDLTPIELKLPKVLEAYGALGDRLKMGDIYNARHVTVQIPHYQGMAIGHTIRVRWASARNTYDSAITTVEKVGPMDFTVPRLEVVDAIGSTVRVSFTVRRIPNGPLHRSEALLLAVDPQKFVLTPPRLTPDQTTVTIRYTGMATGYHARVRVAGVVTRKTEWQDLKTGITAEFSIPAIWIAENKGRTVLINYSVNRPGINEHSQFSQVLRVAL